MKTLTLTLSSNEVVKGQYWEIDNAKANVVICEGMNEHLARYDLFAKYLNKEGFNVYGIDQYGQGKNVKDDLSNLGEWPDDGFIKHVHNVNELVTFVKKNNLPTYIFAHSMGSFITQRYIEEHGNNINKYVLCGSGAKNPALGIGKFLARVICLSKKRRNSPGKFLDKLMFGSFNKEVEKVRTNFDWLSYNEENVDKYIADPLCGFPSKNKFMYEFMKGMKDIYKNKNLKKVPNDISIFIITGDKDPVTEYTKCSDKLIKMYHSLGVKDVNKKIYSHRRHEILNEDNWEEIAKDVVNFFNK